MIYNDLPDQPLAEAVQRGRHDSQFFSWYFCRRKLHDGQLEWFDNAEATINVLTTGNRYGKTSQLAVRHIKRCFYKEGGERFYATDPTRELEMQVFGEHRSAPNWHIDPERYLRTKYYTVHTANLWDTAKLTWDDAMKIIDGSTRLQPFIKDRPRTLPPHIEFQNGARILFRTLGDRGEGIDGHSFYYVSIDEAGWITNLEEILNNVGRVRVADVQGVIDIVGTMKAGLSGDFHKYAHTAALSTGRKIAFVHKDGYDYGMERRAVVS